MFCPPWCSKGKDPFPQIPLHCVSEAARWKGCLAPDVCVVVMQASRAQASRSVGRDAVCLNLDKRDLRKRDATFWLSYVWSSPGLCVKFHYSSLGTTCLAQASPVCAACLSEEHVADKEQVSTCWRPIHCGREPLRRMPAETAKHGRHINGHYDQRKFRRNFRVTATN